MTEFEKMRRLSERNKRLYFTAPIYNIRTRKAVDMKFYAKGETTYSTGSNANITIFHFIVTQHDQIKTHF